jgi:ABC-type Mn2+/Zn2+ transport system permease subunit
MSRDRVFAALLLLIAFATLAASKAFPFVRDFPEPAKIAVVAIGGICALAGVGLWLRKAPEQP